MAPPLAGLWGFALTPFSGDAIDGPRIAAGVERLDGAPAARTSSAPPGHSVRATG